MKWWVMSICMFMGVGGSLFFTCTSRAVEEETEAKLSELTGYYKEVEIPGTDFSLSDYVKDIANGKEIFSAETVWEEGINALGERFDEQKERLIRLFLLGILAGIFANFSHSLGRRDLGETGFYVVYMLLVGTLLGAFFEASYVMESAIDELLTFMKALVPGFAMTVAVTTGSGTSTAFYQLTLIGMTFVEQGILHVLFPVVQIYFLISLANQFTREARFSRMADLIRTFLRWTSRTLLGIVLGLQAVQMLITPMLDKVQKNVIMKAAGSLPGAGGVVSSVAETIVSTGAVIRSAAGVGGLIGICLVCAMPMIQVIAFTLTYKIGAAIIQPVADRRVTYSIHAAAESGKLLLSLLFISCLMFLFSIAIVVGATNQAGI